MKRYFLLGFICGFLLLSACGAERGEVSRAPVDIPQFSVPTFYLDALPDLPPYAGPAVEIYARYGPRAYVDTLQPAADYGQLYPYIGKVLNDNFNFDSDKRYGLVDSLGRIVVDAVYSQVTYTDNGPKPGVEYLVLGYPLDKNDTQAQEIAQATDFFSLLRRFQFAQADGAWVSPPYYGNDARLSADRVIVSLYSDNPEEMWSGRGSKYQIYDLEGNLLFEGAGHLNDFCDGLGRVERVDNDHGEYSSNFFYVDKNGQTVIPGPFSSAMNFKDGKAIVTMEKGALFAEIDTEGNYLLAPKSIGDQVFLYDNTYLPFWDNNLQGMIDRSGNIVLPAAYDYISYLYEGEDNYLLAARKEDQSFDIVDLRSGLIEPADETFTYISVQRDDWLIAQAEERLNDSYTPPDLYLLKGTVRRSFLAAEHGRLDARYVADDLFALNYDNDTAVSGCRVDFFNAVSGEIVKTWLGFNYFRYDQTPQGRVYYMLNGYTQKQVALSEDFELLFSAESMAGAVDFREIRYLKDDLFIARTERFSGLIRRDGSWLIRVIAHYQD